MLQQQGSYYFTEDDKLDLTSDAAKKAVSILQKMKDAELIIYTNNWDGQVAAMKRLSQVFVGVFLAPFFIK